jgi:hypothetical protein
MENQTNLQISIPKPCHEDWNKMTPNEKGSFCSKCAKTVIDFTKKTNEEIKNFLTEKSEKKICGRFMNDQLEKPLNPIDLFIPLNLIPKKLPFNKAFVFALFISFGTTLFSCSTQKGEVVGKISASVDTTKILSSSASEIQTLGDTVYSEIGQVSLNKTEVKKCSEIKGDVAIENIQGEVIMPIDTVTKTNDTLQKGIFKTGKIKTNR